MEMSTMGWFVTVYVGCFIAEVVSYQVIHHRLRKKLPVTPQTRYMFLVCSYRDMVKKGDLQKWPIALLMLSIIGEVSSSVFVLLGNGWMWLVMVLLLPSLYRLIIVLFVNTQAL